MANNPQSMTIMELLQHVIAEYERVAAKAKAVVPSLRDWRKHNGNHANFSEVNEAAAVIFAHASVAKGQYAALNDQKKQRSKPEVELPAGLVKAERRAYLGKLQELATLEAAVDKANSLIK